MDETDEMNEAVAWPPFAEMMRRYGESRNGKRRRMVLNFQFRYWRKLFPWMNWSFMHYITSFWIGLIEDGPVEMLTPRWGGVTFGWLNDGMKPTVWHTVHTLLHPTGKFTGIYVEGAPSSRRQAEEWERIWASERDRKAEVPPL